MSWRVGAVSTDVLVCTGAPFHSYRTVELLRMDISELGYSSAIMMGCVVNPERTHAELISESGAQALVFFDDAHFTVNIWVFDREHGTLVERSVFFSEQERDDASLVALRISELLRAVFIELKTTPLQDRNAGSDALKQNEPILNRNGSAVNEGEDAVPTQKNGGTLLGNGTKTKPANENDTGIHNSKQRYLHKLQLGGSVGISALSFKTAPSAQMLVDAHWYVKPYWGVSFSALVSLTPQRFREEEGRIEVRNAALGPGISYRFFQSTERVRFISHIGVLFSILSVKGSANDAYIDRDAMTYSAAPFGRLSFSVRLTNRVSWRVDGFVATTFPKTQISVIDENIVRLSTVWLCGMTGLDVYFVKRRNR